MTLNDAAKYVSICRPIGKYYHQLVFLVRSFVGPKDGEKGREREKTGEKETEEKKKKKKEPAPLARARARISSR